MQTINYLPSLLAAVFFFYRTVALLENSTFGFWAAWVLAFTPAALLVSQESPSSSYFLATTVLTLYFLVRSLRFSRKWDFTGFFISCLAHIYFSPWGILHILSIFVFLFILAATRRFRDFPGEWYAVVFLLSLALIPWVIRWSPFVMTLPREIMSRGELKGFPDFYKTLAVHLAGLSVRGPLRNFIMAAGLTFFTVGLLRSSWRASLFVFLWIVPTAFAAQVLSNSLTPSPKFLLGLIPLSVGTMVWGFLWIRSVQFRLFLALILMGMASHFHPSPVPQFEPANILQHPAMRWPKSVRISPDGRQAYVQNLGAGNTMIFDTRTLQLLKTVLHEGKPAEGVFTKKGRYFWVSYLALVGPGYPPYIKEWTYEGGWDTKYRFPSVVAVYDTQKGRIIRRIPVGIRPKVVAVSPDEKYVFVSNWTSHSVSIIETRNFQVVKEIPVGPSPRGIAFSKDGRWAYVTVMHADHLAVIDVKKMQIARTLRQSIGKEPRHLVKNRAGTRLYLSANASRLIQVIDLPQEKVIKNIKVGDLPRTIVLSPDEKWLYVDNYGSGYVGVIDLKKAKEKMRLATAETPVGLAVTPDGRSLWVTCYRSHQVQVFRRRPLTLEEIS